MTLLLGAQYPCTTYILNGKKKKQPVLILRKCNTWGEGRFSREKTFTTVSKLQSKLQM